jgi:lauroyl/myristoyl acyltransferase
MTPYGPEGKTGNKEELETMIPEKRISLFFRFMDATLLGIFRLVHFLSRFTPPAVLVALADYLGYALYYTRRGARQYLLETLREALPEIKDETELTRIARKAFGAHFRMVLDLILLERYGDRIMERLVVDQRILEEFDQARAAGKGAIVFAPHLGAISMDPCISYLMGKAYAPMVTAPRDTPVPRYLNAQVELAMRLASDSSNPVFWTGKNTIEKVHEHLGKGGIIGLTFDVTGGTVVDFFGHPTAIASGIAHFACDSGVPIIARFFKRGKGPLDYEMVGYPAFRYTLTGDRSADVQEILRRVVEQGEEMIREAPEQWIGWFGLKSWRSKAQRILEERSNAREVEAQSPGSEAGKDAA